MLAGETYRLHSKSSRKEMQNKYNKISRATGAQAIIFDGNRLIRSECGGGGDDGRDDGADTSQIVWAEKKEKNNT